MRAKNNNYCKYIITLFILSFLFSNVVAVLKVTDVACGWLHTCVVAQRCGNSMKECNEERDYILCWGNSEEGQVAHSSSSPLLSPAHLVNLGEEARNEKVKQIVAGDKFTCALFASGKVKCWGHNNHGQLGIGNTNTIGIEHSAEDSPFVDLGGEAIEISAGREHACAVLADNSLRCWGEGEHGALGYGNKDDVGASPEKTPAIAGNVPIGTKVIHVGTGSGHTCVITKKKKQVKCWGLNQWGQLGQGLANDYEGKAKPAQLPFTEILPENSKDSIVDIDMGYGHSCALTKFSNLYCWGWNVYGQLGYGNTHNVGDNEKPTIFGAVPIGDKIKQVSASMTSTCVLTKENNVKCWGWNMLGQLGLLDNRNRGDKNSVKKEGNSCLVDIGMPVKKVECGNLHCCVITERFGLRCWGDGKFGQLGYDDISVIGGEKQFNVMHLGDVIVLEEDEIDFNI